MSTTNRADPKAGPYEMLSQKIAAGGRLSRGEIEQLAESDDILTVGMLADELRRRMHGTRVTFVRVALCAFDKPLADAVPPAAREVRLTGTPSSVDVALAAVTTAKAVAGDRLLSGFSLADLQSLADTARTSLRRVLEPLRQSGLEAIAEVPVDRLPSVEAAVEALCAAGFPAVRLTLDKAPAGNRADLLMRAVDVQDRYGCIQTINPLPLSLNAFRPTTGYEDVKIVALARLAAPQIPHVQVDWMRYGPKLAQVALTFGADDLDNVSPSDDAPEGRRRAPLEEVRRNIEAAGFTPAARDGRFTVSA